jgi:hypothetical protein
MFFLLFTVVDFAYCAVVLAVLQYIKLIARFTTMFFCNCRPRNCRVSIYSLYFFIRIMNNFGLLFEYLNNIRIFILLNKLRILAQNFKKIKKNQKNPN